MNHPPISRTTDPATSRVGEAQVNRSGRRVSQKERILARLKRGPATNAELAAIALKYTGRLSDLRADGYEIRAAKQADTGVTVYRLKQSTSAERQHLKRARREEWRRDVLDRLNEPYGRKRPADTRTPSLFGDDVPPARDPWSED